MLQLLFATGGVCRATIDGAAHTLVAPCLASIPGGVAHCFNFGPDAAGWILTVAHDHVLEAPLVRNEESVTSLLREPHVVDLSQNPPQAALLASLFAQLDEELRTDRRGRRAGIEYFLRLILLQHWRAVETREDARHDDRDRRLFYDFRALLEQNFNRHWTVPEYASELHLTESRLTDICRRFANRSPKRLIFDRQLREARRLLLFSDSTVSEIAWQLGFKDPAYFARFFNRLTGCSPSAYRAQKVPVS